MLTVYHEEINEGVTVGVSMGTSDVYKYIWHKNWVNLKHNKNELGEESVSQNVHSVPFPHTGCNEAWVKISYVKVSY